VSVVYRGVSQGCGNPPRLGAKNRRDAGRVRVPSWAGSKEPQGCRPGAGAQLVRVWSPGTGVARRDGWGRSTVYNTGTNIAITRGI